MPDKDVSDKVLKKLSVSVILLKEVLEKNENNGNIIKESMNALHVFYEYEPIRKLCSIDCQIK